jgi:hypothetical protein
VADILAPYVGSRLSVRVPMPVPQTNDFFFWRLGRQWGKEPTVVELASLAATHADAVEKLITLADEPHLEVTLILSDNTEQVLGASEMAHLRAALALVRAQGALCARCAGALD